ncbi:MAG TPA: peptidase M17, partial [Catenuloplanes sp.]
MLSIRLVRGPTNPGVLVLPVGQPGPDAGAAAAGPADRADLLNTDPPPPPDVRAEAVALLRADRGSPGQPGAVRDLPRPLREPARVLLVGVGRGDEAGWRAAGAAVARRADGCAALTVGLPGSIDPAAVRGL